MSHAASARAVAPHPATPPDPAAPHPSIKLLILLCVSVPSFMINLDANIVAVSLPSIAQSLHADFAAIEWVISAYTLTFASLVLLAGTLADRFGRKRMLLGGLALFTIASLACGAAPDVAVLNTARAFQGVGAALQLSSALAILSHEFRGPERARAFAFWGSVIGVAITLGPVAGGLITQYFGWQWAFYVNIPVGVIMMALTLYAVRDSRDPNARRIDVPGSISFAGALFLVTLGLISANHLGWSSPQVRVELIVAAILFAAFLLIEIKHPRPMLDLSFFRRPTFVGANVASLAFAAALLTMLTYLPLYFQSGLGFSPQKAGLLMLPMAVPLFIVPRLNAKYLVHMLSGRALLSLGLAFIAIGMLWMGWEATQFRYLSILGGMLVAGIGAGILNGETAKVSMTVIPPERAGMASGVSGTVRFTGIVIGFAALGAVLFDRVAASLARALPTLLESERFAIAQRVVAGDLAGAGMLANETRHVALASFGAGYQSVFFTAATMSGLAAVAAWSLVRRSDTPPLPRNAAADGFAVLSVE
jgi:EmrB/QacA subfamily drug resistance transporter